MASASVGATVMLLPNGSSRLARPAVTPGTVECSSRARPDGGGWLVSPELPNGADSVAMPETGSVKKNCAPSPGTLSKPIAPPACETMRLATARPSPAPCWARAKLLSPGVKGLKSRCAVSAATPRPVSATVKRTKHPPVSSRISSSRTSTRPRSVNFSALSRSLSSTWRTRRGSAATRGRLPAAVSDRRRRFSQARGCSRRTTARAVWSGSQSSSSSCSASSRVSAMTSSSRVCRPRPASSITLTWSACCLGSSARSSNCAMPSSAFSGVRSSWLMLAMKDDLASALASALSRAMMASPFSRDRRTTRSEFSLRSWTLSSSSFAIQLQ